jgi:hypothetical protein
MSSAVNLEVSEVLSRSAVEGTTASVEVRLGNGAYMTCVGRVRCLDGRYVELLESNGRVRRLVVGLIRAARIVPDRLAGSPPAESLGPPSKHGVRLTRRSSGW